MKRQGRTVVAGLLWLLLIFFTSCYLIDSKTWIRFIQHGIGTGWAGTRFEEVWNSFGFFIVKGWHATEYAILFLFCAALLRRWRGASVSAAIWASLLFCAAFAASDEWHQTFVPGRDGCVRDVIIDVAGSSIAALVYWRIARRRETGSAYSETPLVGKWTS